MFSWPSHPHRHRLPIDHKSCAAGRGHDTRPVVGAARSLAGSESTREVRTGGRAVTPAVLRTGGTSALGAPLASGAERRSTPRRPLNPTSHADSLGSPFGSGSRSRSASGSRPGNRQAARRAAHREAAGKAGGAESADGADPIQRAAGRLPSMVRYKDQIRGGRPRSANMVRYRGQTRGAISHSVNLVRSEHTRECLLRRPCSVTGTAPD